MKTVSLTFDKNKWERTWTNRKVGKVLRELIRKGLNQYELALSEGTVFSGQPFGALREARGEVVFSTQSCAVQQGAASAIRMAA